jgi:hypothetical protein
MSRVTAWWHKHVNPHLVILLIVLVCSGSKRRTRELTRESMKEFKKGIGAEPQAEQAPTPQPMAAPQAGAHCKPARNRLEPLPPLRDPVPQDPLFLVKPRRAARRRFQHWGLSGLCGCDWTIQEPLDVLTESPGQLLTNRTDGNSAAPQQPT